ncbi:TauD/TfdA family dioxygenase [Paraburkholderia sp. CNPSo 3274]|uniref:TauD/TfdA dioxygenase family protein n=1 Tax=Paraburkholderia sp. CNPSo 3274 TaxID=2940932 RepID=UPI0020B8F4ED|nr:TauD/TfdA family dioxygenase [Paraburkholderia sp. CNPSo 3274]MCP3707761.1 TauD/TfdA family dioxygenase [Paraburkholderia sp. CNPSo 3274]
MTNAIATPEASPPPAHAHFTLDTVSPAIGAEVSGIDLRETLDDATVAALRAALVQHKVLFLRDQDITPAQHVALARRFGQLEVHPVFPHHAEHPELVLLGGTQASKARENIYHSDVSWRETPSMASMLRCVECPRSGGDTIWVNMAKAYADLPQAVREQLADLEAVHDIMPSFGSRMSAEERAANRVKFPAVTHPVVRTHPESGEKILYVNEGFTTHLANYLSKGTFRVGFDYRYGELELLQYLFRQAAVPEYQVRLRWAPNTIAFWDNRSTQHYAIQDYFPAVRRMMRATIIGDKPF